MTFSVTVVFICFFAIAHVVATMFVGGYRARKRINFGDGDDRVLMLRMRAHGNLTENAPIALLAMAAAEYSGVSATMLWWVGGLFVLGRVLHYFALVLDKEIPARPIGMFVSLIMILWLAGATLFQVFG